MDYLEEHLDLELGTFQTVTNGTFLSATAGTFQSDTDGTFIPLLIAARIVVITLFITESFLGIKLWRDIHSILISDQLFSYIDILSND